METLINTTEVENTLDLELVLNCAKNVLKENKAQRTVAETIAKDVLKESETQFKLNLMLYSEKELQENAKRLRNAILKKNAA